MAYVLFFSRLKDFELGRDCFASSKRYLEIIETPRFCSEFLPPAILLSGEKNELLSKLEQNGIVHSGLVQHNLRTTKRIDGEPPGRIWKEILGQMTFLSVRESVSDPTRLRIEVRTKRSFAHLIPFMAALIRGGAYNPNRPSLALEESHRLIAFFSDAVFISRSDDIYDFWFQLRCSVDLICDAFEKKPFLKPVTDPRQGIGAVEIFRRLPATNCGKCGFATCMEFSVALFTGRATANLCTPLFKHDTDSRRLSLLWVLQVLGLS